MSKLAHKLLQIKQEVDTCLREHLPPSGHLVSTDLVAAMHYSLFNGGKRLRPLLLYLWNEMFGIPDKISTYLGAAVECFHTYTLIHDDLPAMDNDDYRRQQPSCHKQFDEATAILAGTSLLNLSMELLLAVPEISPKTKIILISYFCRLVGCQGIMGGQALDLARNSRSKPYSITEELQIDYYKTGRLFEFCCTAGALLAYVERGAMPVESFSCDGQKDVLESPLFIYRDQKDVLESPFFIYGDQKDVLEPPFFIYGDRKDVLEPPLFIYGDQKDALDKRENLEDRNIKEIKEIMLMNNLVLDARAETTLQLLSKFGQCFGRVYQLADDLEDQEYRFEKEIMLQKLKQGSVAAKKILERFQGEMGKGIEKKKEKKEQKKRKVEEKEKIKTEKAEEIEKVEGTERINETNAMKKIGEMEENERTERTERIEREGIEEVEKVKKREPMEIVDMLREVVEKVEREYKN